MVDSLLAKCPLQLERIDESNSEPGTPSSISKASPSRERAQSLPVSAKQRGAPEERRRAVICGSHLQDAAQAYLPSQPHYNRQHGQGKGKEEVDCSERSSAYDNERLCGDSREEVGLLADIDRIYTDILTGGSGTLPHLGHLQQPVRQQRGKGSNSMAASSP